MLDRSLALREKDFLEEAIRVVGCFYTSERSGSVNDDLATYWSPTHSSRPIFFSERMLLQEIIFSVLSQVALKGRLFLHCFCEFYALSLFFTRNNWVLFLRRLAALPVPASPVPFSFGRLFPAPSFWPAHTRGRLSN